MTEPQKTSSQAPRPRPGRNPRPGPSRDAEGGAGPGAGPPPAVAGLLLAAGGGRRLGGRPKALLPWRGAFLVEHAVRALRDGGCAPILVVLGAAADEVRARADLSGCVLVDNPDWASGMGSSLRRGLDALAGAGPAGDASAGGPSAGASVPTVDAALVALVDQPGVGAAAVSRVRAACRSSATLASAAYAGRRAHPVLLGADHWPGVAAEAEGDRGARGYLRRREADITLVECGDVADPADLDTPADLDRLSPPRGPRPGGSPR